MIRIAELPREAFQALNTFIPSAVKLKYVNALLKVGFDTVEVTSIVSPKVLPQMNDSIDLLKNLDLTGSRSKVMVLVVNKTGAGLAAGIDPVHYISYPFSVSPEFLRLNLHSTMDQSLEVIDHITGLCRKKGKELILYFSMAFGNPYRDPWSIGLMLDWIEKMYEKGIRIMSLSNVAIPVSVETVSALFSTAIRQFPDVEFGMHLHTAGPGAAGILDAAYRSGCRRFDAVINGLGGCPMTGKELLANLDTRNLVQFLDDQNIPTGLDANALKKVYKLSSETFRVDGPADPGLNDTLPYRKNHQLKL